MVIVFPRHDAQRLENKPKTRAPLNKGMPIYNQMSVWAMGSRRRRTENPCFSLIPSGKAPYKVRFSQKTFVTLLSSSFADLGAYGERPGGRKSPRQVVHRGVPDAGIRVRGATYPVRLRSSVSWAIQVFSAHCFGSSCSVFSS